MATTTRDQVYREFMKQAAGSSGKFSLLPFLSIPKDALMMYLTAAAALGVAGGAGLGAASSYIKSKNPKLTALDRKKDFYDRKFDEMENENWLNDVMTAKKKLETSKLSDEERTALEDNYIKLLNK